MYRRSVPRNDDLGRHFAQPPIRVEGRALEHIDGGVVEVAALALRVGRIALVDMDERVDRAQLRDRRDVVGVQGVMTTVRISVGARSRAVGAPTSMAAWVS